MILWLEHEESPPMPETMKAVPDYRSIDESWQETARICRENFDRFQKAKNLDLAENNQAHSDSVSVGTELEKNP